MKSIETDHTPIILRGEALGAIFWRGKQWAVTEHGIECLEATYFIDKSRLIESLGKHSWLDQLAEKTWVDINEFATCWMIAVLFHGYGKVVDAIKLTDAVESMWESKGLS